MHARARGVEISTYASKKLRVNAGYVSNMKKLLTT